jgi:hypothetical protein
MNLVWAAFITIAAAGLAAVTMLLVRRRAPEGGYFNDGDRAAGFFGVLATGFSVLLGFVVFLAFSRYDSTRAGAQAEALSVVQMFETAQLLPQDAREPLSGELICYGRSVVGTEWPQMEAASLPTSINPWVVAEFQTFRTIEPKRSSEQSAYDSWLGQSDALSEARRDRLHAAEGVIPVPVWIVLFFSASLIIMYMLFFADSGERVIIQSLMIASVTAVMVASLLTLMVLDRPYSPDTGGLRPVAMERSLATLQEARSVLHLVDPLPCDEVGRPT